MENITFKALEAREENGGFQLHITQRRLSDLPEGEVTIKVAYSSINFKDALSAGGNKAVTRHYPHTPGIDAAGTVVHSSVPEWLAGDEVIVTGFDLGMNTAGGFAEYIRVPSSWVLRRPEGLSAKEAMIYGTAGLTAGLSVAALLKHGIDPGLGSIAVSGSTGGVGSLSVAILSKLGFPVAAISSKSTADTFLKDIGAVEIIDRRSFEDTSGKALLKPRFQAAIDTVGGNTLATLIKSLRYEGMVTACGMVAGGDLDITVFPFILNGVYLAGIDSVRIPIDHRKPVWEKLAHEWKPEGLSGLAEEIALEEVPDHIARIIAGAMQGRAVIRLNS